MSQDPLTLSSHEPVTPSCTHTFLVEPDTPLFEGSDDDAELVDLPVEVVDLSATPLAESLREAYLIRLEVYHRDLGRAIGGQPAEEAELAVSAFPRLTRSSDVTESIVFDGNLFAVLLDVYVFEGWEAIARIEADVAAKVRPEASLNKTSGGTPELPWLHAHCFFIYCRNMLAVLIASELADIERRAAARIIGPLSVTVTKLATAWKEDFGITRTLVPSSSNVFDVALVDEAVYTFAQKKLMAKLTKAIGDAVDARVAYEQLLENITHLRDALKTVNRKIRRKERHGVKPPAPLVARQERVIATMTQQMNLSSASAGYFSGMRAVIQMNCPLALLVVDGLKPPVTQEKLEHALGTALWALYEEIDLLGAGIRPEDGRVARMLPELTRPADGQPIDPQLVQSFVVPKAGPEAAVAEAAIAALSADRGLLALLHTPTWQLLQGDYGAGSFGHVVLHRYLETLGDRMDRLAVGHKAVEEFFRVFNKWAAALAVALLVTPLAEWAPAVRTVSVIGDLALLSYQVSSAIGQIAALDDAIAAQLLEPDAYATSNLAKLGELMVARPEIATTMTVQLQLELLGIIAGGRWNVVRKLLVTRGFLTDLQTIFEESSG